MSDWDMELIQYDDALKEIQIVDEDNSIFKGSVNEDRTKIVGAFCDDDDPLNCDSVQYVRANDAIYEKIFFSRIPNFDGSVTYKYQAPRKLNDALVVGSVENSSIEQKRVIQLVENIINQKYGRLESLLVAKDNVMVLNNGTWKGKQVVPKAWIELSTQTQVIESKFFNYGYQWWCRTSKTKPWWQRPPEYDRIENNMAVALGWDGQNIFIVNNLKMVVVMTASNYDYQQLAMGQIGMMVEDIVLLFENK